MLNLLNIAKLSSCEFVSRVLPVRAGVLLGQLPPLVLLLPLSQLCDVDEYWRLLLLLLLLLLL